MPAPLSGPGLGLQIPQNLYPSFLTNAPYDYGTNQVALAGGQQLVVPAGTWYISLGLYLLAEYLDPVMGIWVPAASGTAEGGAPIYVKSDGFNWRIANRLGTPVGGVVLTGGANYVQATTSIAVTGGGGSTWVPIVGGAYSVSSIIGYGAGYGVPPLVIIPSPPNAANNPNGVGGKPASAYAVISSGTLSTVSIIDQGAGYPSGVTIVLQPNPTDPNLSSGITLATVAFSTVFAGSITGALCTNPGSAIATPQNLSLTVSGAGTNGSVAPVMVTTMTACSVSVGGAGYGLAGYVMANMAGGGYPQGSLTNTKENNNIMMRPRPGNIRLTVSGSNGSIAAQAGLIYDSGLFFVAGNNNVIGGLPSINVALGASAGTAGSVIGPAFVNTFGGSNVFDVAVMQSAP